jgi:hypothetical protein
VTAADAVNPLRVGVFDYPTAVSVATTVGMTALLLFVAGRFDHTGGVLTISIMIVLAMIGATAYCLVFTIPADDITPGVVGALSAGFGAVVVYWLGRQSSGYNPPVQPPEPPKGPPDGE